MKTITILVSALFFLNSCKQQKISNKIIIEGEVKNMPDGKIYLTEAHHWQVPLDSTTCTNGHFVFRINTDSSFVPYMAAIHFPDNSKPTKLGGLFFRNYMLGADSMRYSTDGFYLEKGYTRIEGNNNKNPYLRVFAGKETDIMYKNQFTDFGWLGNKDSAKRLQRIAFFKKEINKYPFSYFLLESIYNARAQYSETEINEFLSLFDSDVQQSKLDEKFRTYLANPHKPNKPYPNLSLLNPANQRRSIIDSNSKLTMLVFWASWCGPCRMEIPMLKEIQNEYKRKGLNLVSISIDDKRDNWINALNKEKTQWPQYIVDKDKIELVEAQFNFSSIPLVVFTDKTGTEIKRFSDYNKERKKEYETVINQYIK